MKTLLKDRSLFDSLSDSLYRVLILMAKAYMETLLKDKSPLDAPFDILYLVLTLTGKAEIHLEGMNW